jgi:hypothetical protein
MSGAIWAAYADCGAIEVACPHCDAEPGKWCTREDGRVRRAPCVARAVASGVVTTPGKQYARDFSEPGHPTD